MADLPLHTTIAPSGLSGPSFRVMRHSTGGMTLTIDSGDMSAIGHTNRADARRLALAILAQCDAQDAEMATLTDRVAA